MRVVGKGDIRTPLMAESGEIIYEMIGRDPEIGETTHHSFVLVGSALRKTPSSRKVDKCGTVFV